MRAEYPEFQTLVVEQQDRLLTVTMNRPESLNAVGGGMHEELEEFFHRVRFDNSVGAILLRGAGRAFSSGGDVKGMAATAQGGAEPNLGERAGGMLQGAKNIIASMLDVEQPIVSAVQGYAMGLGATLALCADVCIAAEDAILADTHVSIGLVAGDGGALIWPMLLPINTAKYYLMTGERITGKEAERLGLVLRAVPKENLAEESLAVAWKLANGPSLAIRWTKTSVNKILRERLNLLLDTSLLLEFSSMLTADHKEATAAFVERREPKFTGR
ncbi:enoyl-CoA hydratase/isomerase family protein [Paractinoplanes globisporus]|uniref:Enoyl-CoA hydratase/isomerase family protein n=1 Tax=Paractinoplanes globisporus TaxID=113565 RepID=A0ABW6WC86_9ACTN|nr:enoyl-CoA hydratase-related protein [Actinoplanes globisporus]